MGLLKETNKSMMKQEKQMLINKAKQLTNPRLEEIIFSLLPEGEVHGNSYVALNPTRADKNLGSFRIDLLTGKWIDFATYDCGGDIISLYAYVKGLSQYQAAEVLAGQNENKLISKLWAETISANASPVEKYLSARGFTGEIPETIRYHPKLYHSGMKEYYPAMVSAVTIEKEIVGLHRTYLCPKSFKKAEIEPNKMILGKVKGGSVKLAPAGKTLIIAEGIETALSISLATSLPVWASLSASSMRSIIIPSLCVIEEVVIAADHDEAGIRAADILAERLINEGYRVRLALPPKYKTDFNDILNDNTLEADYENH
jgi:hypothetical protein